MKYEQCQINQNEGYIQYLQMWYFWSAFMYIRSRSKQTKTVKTQDLFLFFSLSLSFTMKWEICQHQSAKGMPTDHSHTHLTTEKKPITTCQKRELVLCVLFLKSSKCMGDSTIELVFNPCGGEGSRERGVITVHQGRVLFREGVVVQQGINWRGRRQVQVILTRADEGVIRLITEGRSHSMLLALLKVRRMQCSNIY